MLKDEISKKVRKDIFSFKTVEEDYKEWQEEYKQYYGHEPPTEENFSSENTEPVVLKIKRFKKIEKREKSEGERERKEKIGWFTVIEIRKLYDSCEGWTIKALAEKYGLGYKTVWKIVNRETYTVAR